MDINENKSEERDLIQKEKSIRKNKQKMRQKKRMSIDLKLAFKIDMNKTRSTRHGLMNKTNGQRRGSRTNEIN